MIDEVLKTYLEGIEIINLLIFFFLIVISDFGSISVFEANFVFLCRILIVLTDWSVRL